MIVSFFWIIYVTVIFLFNIFSENFIFALFFKQKNSTSKIKF